jgi:ferrous-iron efflux pump FieF
MMLMIVAGLSLDQRGKLLNMDSMTSTITFSAENGRLMRIGTYASVMVATVLIAIKFTAFVHTDSVALLSTLVDSLLDAAASMINLFAVHHALMPADREHRFGHGKAESLAGLAQAAFVAGSALFLIFEAGRRLVAPKPVEHEMFGVIVMAVATLLTILLVQYQRHVVRQTGSTAIQADSLHYVGDVLVNLSVILSLSLSALLNWPSLTQRLEPVLSEDVFHAAKGLAIYLDPVLAFGITGYIFLSAWRIASQALNQLMDRELPEAERDRIRRIALSHPAVSDAHDLRTRTSGQTTFIQLHLEMPAAITLIRAHQIAEEVEAEIRKAYPAAEVIIHEDPEGVPEARPSLDN